MGDYKITATADYIYDSLDRGVTWVKESGSPNENWTHIAGSSDGTTIIASTNDPSKIYISYDSGATYNIRNVFNDPAEICKGLASSSDGKTLYVGGEIIIYDYPRTSIYRSLDSGTTWSKVYTDPGPKVYSMTCSADGQTVIVVGGFGESGYQFFKVSMDSGNIWKNVSITVDYNTLTWTSVACSSDGKFIVASNNDGISNPSIWTFTVGLDGVIVPTKQVNAPNKTWYSLACSGSGSTIIVSSDGGSHDGDDDDDDFDIDSLIISYNYGVDWVNKSFISKGTVACSNDGMCMACASYGSISTSFDGGTTWIQQPGSNLGSVTIGWTDIMITSKPVCVLGKTKILMGDGSLKPIKDIVRGERVITDKETGATKQVARVLSSIFKGAAVRIPKGTLGSTEEVICTEEHPVWSEDGTYRTKSKDVKGAIRFQLWDTVYTLQYEEEGTYYAEGIRMDSVSPYYHVNRLPKQLYFNKAKHDKLVIVKDENDKRRGKPKMI